MKTLLITLSTVILTLLLSNQTHKSSADDSLKPRLMSQCLQEFKEFECYAILNSGSYPTKPFIDMRGSPVSELLPKMQLPVKNTNRGTPPAELTRP